MRPLPCQLTMSDRSRAGLCLRVTTGREFDTIRALSAAGSSPGFVFPVSSPLTESHAGTLTPALIALASCALLSCCGFDALPHAPPLDLDFSRGNVPKTIHSVTCGHGDVTSWFMHACVHVRLIVMSVDLLFAAMICTAWALLLARSMFLFFFLSP